MHMRQPVYMEILRAAQKHYFWHIFQNSDHSLQILEVVCSTHIPVTEVSPVNIQLGTAEGFVYNNQLC